MSKQLLRHCLSRPLPTLKQGSTLSIRSSVPATNLSIRSSWRDDGNLSMLQTLRKGGIETDVIISKEKDRSTSMGREESFISILLKPKDMTTPGESAAKGATNPQNNYQESVPPHPVEKNIILDDGTMFPDSEEWSPPPAGLRRIEYNDGIAHITKNEVDDQKQVTSLFLEVPEKANIEVDLINGG